ncbi:hypothetical protein [uncultured Bacteroides sp.]|uniref:hypothetical protein n=1 Tax=uncultured Bacteroides sp. TaxID=162156 RepID=UPI0025914CED|nr:hypothetical protein [uncultured Bacteroides sp.]
MILYDSESKGGWWSGIGLIIGGLLWVIFNGDSESDLPYFSICLLGASCCFCITYKEWIIQKEYENKTIYKDLQEDNADIPTLSTLKKCVLGVLVVIIILLCLLWLVAGICALSSKEDEWLMYPFLIIQILLFPFLRKMVKKSHLQEKRKLNRLFKETSLQMWTQWNKEEENVMATERNTLCNVNDSGNVTSNEISDDEIEVIDDGIYYKTKIWDGVKYTIKKQRVFVYKRSYHLDMGELPRFHICRCKTMDSYMSCGTLKLEYRKSDSRDVWVKNMDACDRETQISHLPLCMNCYKKLKQQYSWLDSEMDNVDFVKNIINRLNWV